MTKNKTNSTNNLNRIPSWVTATVIALSELAQACILTSGCSTIRTILKLGEVEYRLEKEGCSNQIEQHQLPQSSTTSTARRK